MANSTWFDLFSGSINSLISETKEDWWLLDARGRGKWWVDNQQT
jgi:hypothetical protein